MSTNTNDQLKLTQDWLEGYDYLPVLRAFSLVGVATFPDLQRATGFTTDVLKRILQRLTQRPPGLEEGQHALREMPSQTVFVGQLGRRPQIFRLEKMGAALLRKSGDKTAEACRLSQETEVSHALGFRAVAAAALAAGLQAEVDKPIAFVQQRTVRPDVVVAPPEGSKYLVEVEQRLQPQTLDRIVEKVRHLRDFFLSPEAQGYAPEVRVLFNVTDSEADFAQRAWADIIADVAREGKAALPCTFWAGRLLPFLETPAWDNLTAFTLLTPAAKPAVESTGLMVRAEEISERSLAMVIIPASLRYRSAPQQVDDQVVLRAYLRVIEADLDRYPTQSDVAFLHLFGYIYGVSHKWDNYHRFTGLMPWGSLILLRKYLELPAQRRLRVEVVAGLEEIERALAQGGISMACHYYTKLIWGRILKYYGMTQGGWLRVWVVPPFAEYTRAEMHVLVQLGNWRMHSELKEGADEEGKRLEAALAWVLDVLVVYAEELGLR